VHFQVLVEDKPRPVELAFGGAQDLRAISHWRAPAAVRGQPAVRDTIEFARLASKRHRHYLRSIPAAVSLADFRRIISENPQAEMALMLLVRANWFGRSSILGLAQCRRTFCHHLVLEFLSVHPAIVGQLNPRVAGVGKGLVYGLAEIAGQPGSKLIWGEATAYSSPFYAHILGDPRIEDHFFIRGTTLHFRRREFREKFFGGLDEACARRNTLDAMKEKVSEAEMIRRLKEVTADEDKYFPGVLGNPVTFAGRWGLSRSKSYLDFKAKQLAAEKRRRAKARNGGHTIRARAKAGRA